MESLRQVVEELQNQQHFGEKALLSIVLLLSAMLLYRALIWCYKRLFSREKVVRPLTRFTRILLSLTVLAAVIFTWSDSVNTLIFLATLFLLLIGLALKDLVLNLTGYVYIYFRRPFSVGDRVEISGHRGEVYDIHLFEFTLLEIAGDRLSTESITGRVLHIPNRDLFSHVLANYSQDQPYLWSELKLPITFESNREKAERILLDIAQAHLKSIVTHSEADSLSELGDQLEISETKALPSITIDVTGSGVTLILRFLAPYREVGQVRSQMWREILTQLAVTEDIEYSPTVYRIIQSPPANPYQ